MLSFDLSEAAFVTERLAARGWRVDEDAVPCLEMYSDPEVVRYIGNELVTDEEKMRERLRTILARNEKWAAPYGSWGVFERATGLMVGTSLLKPLPASGTGRADSSDIEIGWHLARRHWGRGFATEMGRALLARGFDAGLAELHAVVDSPNHRSQAVARRIGMHHQGQTSRYYDLTLEHFKLARAEWLQRADEAG